MRLWIDTNCARGATKIHELAKLAREKGVAVAIHPQVYLERRRQMRAECKVRDKVFSPTAFDGLLEQEGIAVPTLSLDQRAAAAWADELDRRYPTDEQWEQAKKDTIGGRLKEDFQVLPGKMPMTADWLIALQIEAYPDARIITNDTGEEWRALREARPPRAFSWSEAMEWLQSLGSEAPRQ